MRQLSVAALVAALTASSVFAQNATQLVNSDANGAFGSYGALVSLFIPNGSALSDDGRYAAFSTNQLLDAADANGKLDIYVKDLRTGAVVRVSVASDGAEGNDTLGASGGASPFSTTVAPAMSGDGRFIVFQSTFNNLVVGDGNGTADVFLHDRDADVDGIFDETGAGERKTIRCSVSAAGGDGGGSALATPAANASVSDDGRYVCFQSGYTNLVAGDTNGAQDTFVFDRDSDGNGSFDDVGGTLTRRMSMKLDGTEAGTAAGSAVNPSISADGRFVTFSTSFTNLVAGADPNGNTTDIIVRDRDADDDGILDETGLGEQALVRVNVHDTGTPAVTGEGTSTATAQHAISADGRYVVFTSVVKLVAADVDGLTNCYLRDRDGDADGIYDEGPAGADNTYGVDVGGNNNPTAPVISPNGRFVAFRSFASNLVAGDVNGASDHFVLDRQTNLLKRVSIDSASGEGEGASAPAGLTGSNGGAQDVANNGAVLFRSSSNNLIPGDTAGVQDLFVNALWPRTEATTVTPSIGTTVNVAFDAPFDPNTGYLGAAAFGFSPGFSLSNGLILPLNLDVLLYYSVTSPAPFFTNYGGFLDGNGHADGQFTVAADPALIGFVMFTGFIVNDPSWPDGVKGMSNALKITFAP